MRGIIAAAMLLAGAAQAQAQSTRMCRVELGARPAAVLVQRCILVSPATHPPCNASNPCDFMRDEIARSCRYIQAGPVPGVAPSWCKEYADRP